MNEQQTTDGRPTFVAVVQQIHEDLGGIAMLSDIADVLARNWPDHYAEASRRSVNNKIRDALRTPDDDDLPTSYSVGSGKYMQRRLFGVPEYEYLATSFKKAVRTNERRLDKLVAECSERLGHDIDIESLDVDLDAEDES